MNSKAFNNILLRLIVIIIVLFTYSCSQDDTVDTIDTNTSRILEINLGDDIRYSFEYFNKFYSITPQVRLLGEFEDANTGFEITNFNDEIEIRFSNGAGSQGPLFATGIFENGQLKEVKRYFSSGTTYTYDFDYQEDSLIISLILDADGPEISFEPQIIEFGNYKFDNNGNIVEVLKYRNVNEEPTEDDLYEQSIFTYDTANNAWKDQIAFFFGWQILPDVRFFNTSNILTYQRIKFFNQPAGNFEFRYEYDDLGRTSKAFTAWFPLNNDGFVEEFVYED